MDDSADCVVLDDYVLTDQSPTVVYVNNKAKSLNVHCNFNKKRLISVSDANSMYVSLSHQLCTVNQAIIFPTLKSDCFAVLVPQNGCLIVQGETEFCVVFGRIRLMGFERSGSQFSINDWTYACGCRAGSSLNFISVAVKESISVSVRKRSAWRVRWRLKKICAPDVVNEVVEYFGEDVRSKQKFSCLLLRRFESKNGLSLSANIYLEKFNIHELFPRSVNRDLDFAMWSKGNIVSHDKNVFHESVYWQAFSKRFIVDPLMNKDTSSTSVVCSLPDRIIACGPKDAGKSSFLRFLSNRFWSQMQKTKGSPMPEQPHLFYMDLDIGQSEFFISSCLTLIRLKGPLFGPPMTNLTSALSDEPPLMSLHFGSVNIMDNVDRYVAGVGQLMQFYEQHILPNHSNCLLLVNTCGWVEGYGLKLLNQVMEIACTPTTVIAAMLPFSEVATFTPPKMKIFVKQLNDGMLDKNNLIVLQQQFRTDSKNKSFGNVELRRAQLITYLSLSITRPSMSNLPLGSSQRLITSVTPYSVKWSTVAVMLSDQSCENISFEMCFRILNANIVALCVVNDDELRDFVPDDVIPIVQARPVGADNKDPPAASLMPPPGEIMLPCSKRLPKLYCPNDDSRLPRVIGFGLVRGIDFENESLLIITPLSSAVLEQVNLLTVGSHKTPDEFFTLPIQTSTSYSTEPINLSNSFNFMESLRVTGSNANFGHSVLPYVNGLSDEIPNHQLHKPMKFNSVSGYIKAKSRELGYTKKLMRHDRWNNKRKKRGVPPLFPS